MYKFGFIGVGNMGGALAEAVCKSEQDVMLADKDELRASARAEGLGCGCGSAEDIASSCDYIFLGVKPQTIGRAGRTDIAHTQGQGRTSSSSYL